MNILLPAFYIADMNYFILFILFLKKMKIHWQEEERWFSILLIDLLV